MKQVSGSREPEKLRTEFTREGGYYVLVLAFVLTGAILRDINLMMLIAGAMVGLWVTNWRLAATAIRKLEVRRTCPDTICAGDVLVADVQLANLAKRRRKRGIVVTDTIRRVVGQKDAEAVQGRVMFDRVPARGSETRSYQGRVWTRGRYRLGPLEVSCGFPFGLMRRRGTVDDQHQLTVYPRLGRLMPAWARLHDDALVGTQRVRSQQSRTQGDFYGLRDWREGDSQRWVHWRTSARRGKLVVRQYERQRRQDVILLLDIWQAKKPTDVQADTVELAVSFAATIVEDLCRRGGSQLHLVVGGQELATVRGVASQGLLVEMMSALATARAAEADRVADMLREGLHRPARNSRLILISTRSLDLGTIAVAADLPEQIAQRLGELRSLHIDCSSVELDEFFTLE